MAFLLTPKVQIRKAQLLIRQLPAALAQRLPEPLRQQWLQLPARDKRALAALALILGLTLGYLLVWQPVLQHKEVRTNWQQNQSLRLERAQLAAYDRLNRFGMVDLLPLDLWLQQELPAYRMSLVSHQPGADATAPGQLQLRYSDSRRAQAFLQALSRLATLDAIRVDQNTRMIRLNYRPDAEYAERVR